MNPTAGEIIDAASAKKQAAPDFFVEIMNVTTFKCLGLIYLSASEVDRDWTIGYNGRRVRTLTKNIEVQRGPRQVTVCASKGRPLDVTETLVPMEHDDFQHPLNPTPPGPCRHNLRRDTILGGEYCTKCKAHFGHIG